MLYKLLAKQQINLVKGNRFLQQNSAGLCKTRYQRFSSLSVITPGFLVAKIQSMFKSRAGSAVHIIGTFSGSLFIDRKLMLSIQDLQENQFIKENDLFQLFGVLKVGSIKIKKGSLETKFQITNFEQDIDVYYNGMAKFEFKEGETIVLTGYLSDITDKSKVMCIEYQTKHSMEVNNWQDNINKKKDSFGVK